jgi:hypothetical protein
MRFRPLNFLIRKDTFNKAKTSQRPKEFMQRRSYLLASFLFMGWLLILLSPPPLFSQALAEYGREKGPAPKEPDSKSYPISGFLRDVVVLSKPQGARVELTGDGLTSAYQTFKLSKPPRLVVDFPGVVSSYPKKFLDLNYPMLTDIRFGQHPDKLRLVFTFPGTEVPSFEIERKSGGLVLWIGKLEKEPGEPSKPIKAEKKEAFSEPPSEEKSIPVKPTVTDAAPQERLSEERKEILQDSKTKNEAGIPYSGTRISLDYVNADIRNIFRFLAESGKVEIVPDPEVRGTITLRLTEIPWDEALNAILNISNLKKVQEGKKIRILTR